MAPYLTAAQVRTRQPLIDDDTKYSDASIDLLVTAFEGIVEEYRGIAYVNRTAVETVRAGRQSGVLLLEHAPVVSLTSVMVDGTSANVSLLEFDKATGRVWDGTWSYGDEVVVTYVHGLTAPPEVALRACAEFVRASIMSDKSGTSRDVIAQGYDGTITRYSTPNWHEGRPTGFLEVDALLNSLEDHRIPGIG